MDGLSQNICSAANCQSLTYFGTSGQQCYSERPKNMPVLGDIEFSLKQILHRPGIMKIIQEKKRSTRNFTKSASSNVSGIIFSHCYQNLTRSGCFLSEMYSLNAQFNTDGVKSRKSSGIKLWSIYMANNKLPSSIRFYRGSLIVASLWKGKTQPPYFHFFYRFCETAHNLYNNGFGINDYGNQVQVRVSVVLGTTDLPAKCKVLNMSQFNRFFGCSTCEEPGQRKKKVVQVYPNHNKAERYPRRNSSYTIANKAPRSSLKDRDTGIVGYSGLIGMECFDLVLDIVPDYMHGALLGTAKVLMY